MYRAVKKASKEILRPGAGVVGFHCGSDRQILPLGVKLIWLLNTGD